MKYDATGQTSAVVCRAVKLVETKGVLQCLPYIGYLCSLNAITYIGKAAGQKV